MESILNSGSGQMNTPKTVLCRFQDYADEPLCLSSVPDVEVSIIARVHAIEIECPRIISELDYRARSPICGSFRALSLGWIMPSIPRAPEFHRPAFSA
jgi:hypothetical protein